MQQHQALKSAGQTSTLRDGYSQKEVTREVPHSNKNQLNPIHSFSSNSFKKIFTQGCSKIEYASIPGRIFVLHCSTKQKFFGATWLGLQSGKFKNIETLDFFPQWYPIKRSVKLFFTQGMNVDKRIEIFPGGRTQFLPVIAL